MQRRLAANLVGIVRVVLSLTVSASSFVAVRAYAESGTTAREFGPDAWIEIWPVLVVIFVLVLAFDFAVVRTVLNKRNPNWKSRDQ